MELSQFAICWSTNTLRKLRSVDSLLHACRCCHAFEDSGWCCLEGLLTRIDLLAMFVRANSALNSINLSGNQIGDGGAARFARALRVRACFCLHEKGHIVDVHITCFAVSHAQSDVSLTELHLSGQGRAFGLKVARTLIEALQVRFL